MTIGNTTIVKISSTGLGKDFLFPGHAANSNGSDFVPDLSANLSESGVQIDHGSVYAGAILYEQPEIGGRSIYQGSASLSGPSLKGLPNASQFDNALTLPRVIALDDNGQPTWEIAPEMAALRTPAVTMHENLKLAPGDIVKLELPVGASPDSVEVRLNFSLGGEGAIALGLRGTADGTQGVTVAYSSSAGLAVDVGARRTTAPPLAGAADTLSSLRVFLDRAIIEAHVNARRSITTSYFPADITGGTAFTLTNPGKTTHVTASVEIWGMGGMFA